MLRFRSIKPLVVANIRQLANNSGSEQFNAIEKCTKPKWNGMTPKQNSFQIAYLEKYGCRLIHTCCSEWKSTKDESTTNIKIDQFRAEEEKIEREYEEQEKQHLGEESRGNSAEDQAKIQKLRSEILEASLKFVPTYGWSLETIVHGAESINYPGVAHGIFPNGAIELVQHFYTKCNRELIETLQQEMAMESEKDMKSSTEALSPRDFAIKAIRLRLEMVIPYKDTWPQALAIMTLPQNVPTALAQLLTLVDDICYCAGDRSVDIGWYTRRIGIASIYKMVEIYLLQDKSPDHQQTWEFLERRMNDGIQVQEFLSASDQKTQTMAKALGSAFQTARNILGINCDKK